MRFQLQALGAGIAQSKSGAVRPNAPGTLVVHADGTQVPIYPSDVGGVAVNGTFVTDDYGLVPGWIDQSYMGIELDLTIPPRPTVRIYAGGPPGAPAVPRGSYSNATTYVTGNIVKYGGYPYISLVDSNLNHQPDISPTQWQKMFDLPTDVMLTDAQNTMTKGQIESPVQMTRQNRCQVPRPGLCLIGDLAITPAFATGAQSKISTDIPGTMSSQGDDVNVLKLTAASTGNVYYSPSTAKRAACYPGESYTTSIRLYQPSTNAGQRSYRIEHDYYDANSALIQSISSPVTAYGQDAWQVASFTSVAPANATKVGVIVYAALTTTGHTGDVFYADAQLDEGDTVVNSYGDGSVNSWGWEGTAWRSASRSPSGSDAHYRRGTDSTGNTTQYRIDSKAKGWFKGIDAMGQKITGVADGTADTDAANMRVLRSSVTTPLGITRFGTSDLTDVYDTLSGNSVRLLQEQYELRQRQLSEGVFAGIRVAPGTVIFAFTSDDGHSQDYTELWPAIRSLAIPWSMGIIYGQIGNATYTTWAQIQEMRDYGGCEVVCHSRNHTTGITRANFVSEGVSVADDMAAGVGGGAQFNVDALIQPGTWTSAEFNLDSPSKLDPPAPVGYWLRSRYSVVTAYIDQYRYPGVYVYPLAPHPRRFGLARSGSIDSTSLAAIQGLVKAAQAHGGGVIVFNGHFAGVDAGTGMTEVTNILNWIVAQRDAGAVELMTLTAAMHARFDSAGPRNLWADGDFHLGTPGTYGSGGNLGGWTQAGGAPTIVEANAQTGAKPPGNARSMILNAAADLAFMRVSGGLRSMLIEFDARTKNGAARSSQELQIQAIPHQTSYGNAANAPTLTYATNGANGPQWASIGTGWAHYKMLIGCDPQADGGYQINFGTTGSGGVEVANVKSRQI